MGVGFASVCFGIASLLCIILLVRSVEHGGSVFFRTLLLLGVLFGLFAVTFCGALLVKGQGPRRKALGGIVMGLPALVLLGGLTWYGWKDYQRERSSACGANINALGKGIRVYMEEMGQPPANMQALLDESIIGPLRCPLAEADRGSGYCIHFAGLGDSKGFAIIACDLKGNHKNGRNVLTFSGQVRFMPEADFQAELAKPENAGFRAALLQAEGP